MAGLNEFDLKVVEQAKDNIGALRVLAELKNLGILNEELLASMQEKKLEGAAIWELYKDRCRQQFGQFVAVLKGDMQMCKCGGLTVRVDKYDRFCCVRCAQWTESACADPTCEFCTGQEKPAISKIVKERYSPIGRNWHVIVETDSGLKIRVKGQWELDMQTVHQKANLLGLSVFSCAGEYWVNGYEVELYTGKGSTHYPSEIP
jgi:hypothetical protein